MHSFISVDNISKIGVNNIPKQYIKIVKQSDKEITLLFVGHFSDIYKNKIIDKITHGETSLVWKLKFKHESYKLYKHVSIINEHDNYIVLSVKDVSFYTSSRLLVNTTVKFTKRQWNDLKNLIRIIKLSNLKTENND